MDIRRLGPDDARDYRALRLRTLREFPEAFTSSFEEEEAKPIDASQARLGSEQVLFWGAFDGPVLCGMVALEREQRFKVRHKGKVVAMCVAREYFGTGVGRALLDALVHGARELGLEMLGLTVTEGNAAATKLYEAAGFRSLGIEPRAIKVEGRHYGKNHMYLELTPS